MKQDAFRAGQLSDPAWVIFTRLRYKQVGAVPQCWGDPSGRGLCIVCQDLKSVVPPAIIVAVKVLFADFVESYAEETESHVLLWSNCDSEGSFEKLCKGKSVGLVSIMK